MNKDMNKVMNKELLVKVCLRVNNFLKNNTDGHDVAHIYRVYQNAVYIADNIENCDKDVIILSALLHDVDDYKLFHTKNNENARSILISCEVEKDKIEEICNIINSVSFSKNKKPATIEGQIVQDADRLDAIGAIGIGRTFAYGGCHKRTLQDSIEHFFKKLLRLKSLMNTDVAKDLAEERHLFLLKFLEEWNLENNSLFNQEI